LDARDHPETPHILVLDEMNLSHVERYFADILSAMESGEEITLHSDGQARSPVPERVRWPKNVYVVGTVNVDETTYMFSPKVLDRANVVEFRVDPERLAEAGSGASSFVDLPRIEGKGAEFAALFARRDHVPDLAPSLSARVREELRQI